MNALTYLGEKSTINYVLLFESPIPSNRIKVFKETFVLVRINGELLKRFQRYLVCNEMIDSEKVLRLHSLRADEDINYSFVWRYITNK